MRLPFHAAAFAIAFALAATLPPSSSVAESESVVVFAAASLKNAFDEIAAGWTAKSGVPVKTSYAASPPLAKQIEEGAPADLFISADLDWMDYVDKKNLLKAGTRVNLLGNTIVLVASKDWTKGDVKIEPNFALADLLGDGRLAMAGVTSVPAGKYGKAALTKLGIWDGVAAPSMISFMAHSLSSAVSESPRMRADNSAGQVVRASMTGSQVGPG